MPLVHDPDLTNDEISQFRLLQIKVFEKLCIQMNDALEHNKHTKLVKIESLMCAYGTLLQNKDMLELDKELQLHNIFEQMMNF